jgi:DNA-binding LytR/AlgR family response regulator
VARELGWTLLNLAAIGLANAFLSASLGLVPFSPATLGRFTVFTALIGLFPITLAVLATEARRARSYTDASAAINSGLRGVEPSAPAPDPAAALPPQGPSGLTLPTEGGAPLQLGDEDLLFARAADNYVEVFHLHDGAHRRTVIRSSLKAVSEALEPRGGRFMRCHKSHLVDLHKVLRVSGNAQGLRLHLTGVEQPIPVSRQLSGTVRERLAVRP